MAQPPCVYWDYLRLQELLSLQTGVEGDESELSNDEVLFIVIHQIDELWFKLALRELEAVRDLFAQDPVPEQSLASAVRSLRRLGVLFHQASAHFALMETLTTRDYLGFRDKLSPASGFQSYQMREVEILFGLAKDARVPLGHEDSYRRALTNPDGSESHALRRVNARVEDRPNLRDAVAAWLRRTPIQGSRPGEPGDAEVVETFIEDFLGAHAKETGASLATAGDQAGNDADRQRLRSRFEAEMAGARAFLTAQDIPEEQRSEVSRIRAALVFIESYRELPLLAWPREVLEGLISVEQAFLIFRQRHARMVERVIGRRTGTGGSAGVDYLDATALKYRIFGDAWAVRTLLLRKQALPPLERGDAYGFASG